MFRRNIPFTCKRLYSSASTNAVENPKWDIYCGLCLERKPVISRDLTQLEEKFQRMQYTIEDERSMKSDHELLAEAAKRRAKEFEKGKISTQDMEVATLKTAHEFEDESRKEFEEFKLSPRRTEADEKNDTKSTQRELDRHLLFIVNETIGAERVWMLPQDVVQESESLRDTAERLVREKCGTVRVRFYGNAPCGFHKYRYPAAAQKQAVGAKVFFIKAQLMGGSGGETEYAWVTRPELATMLKETYLKSVRQFLVDDELDDAN